MDDPRRNNADSGFMRRDETRQIGGPPQRTPRRVRVVTRDDVIGDRSSPWMRFDVLQLAAWTIGLGLVIAGLVALARAGFTELTFVEPVVEVAGLPMTPFLALLLVLTATGILTLATGVVDDRSLRVVGVVLGVIGVVWLIEPEAFNPYLGISTKNGAAALSIGAGLVLASFTPPLAVRRPGTEL